MGLLQAHFERFGAYPQNLILGVDPWVFNKNNDQDRFKTIQNECNRFLAVLGAEILRGDESPQTRYDKLFSAYYLTVNIRFARKNRHNGFNGFDIVDGTDIDDLLRMPDGTVCYSFAKRNPDFEKVKELAINYTKGYVYSIQNFRRLDNTELFERLIAFLQSKGVRIYFYLPPYNPITYDLLINDSRFKIILDAEKYMIETARKFSIRLVGSYNPHNLDLANSDFFDGMHPLEQAYVKIFKRL